MIKYIDEENITVCCLGVLYPCADAACGHDRRLVCCPVNRRMGGGMGRSNGSVVDSSVLGSSCRCWCRASNSFEMGKDAREESDNCPFGGSCPVGRDFHSSSNPVGACGTRLNSSRVIK